jgi:V/A-type H+-transporting ATPase subunit E
MMDSQLNELIETIKRDGVQTAEKQAEQIIAAATERAEKITSDAEHRAQTIIAEANTQKEKIELSGNEALKQAARDMVLGVEAQLGSLFGVVVTSTVEQALNDEVLKRAIIAVVETWAKEGETDIAILLSDGDRAQLESSLRGELSQRLAAGAEIRSSNAVKSGFRVEMRDGTVYYDFTAEAIAEALSAYVGPRLGKLLRESVQGA